MPDKDEATPWWLWLQEQLRARDWTFADLCKKAGLDDSIGTRWKKGKLPMADNIRRVAAALDVPVMEAMLKAEWITDGDLGGEKPKGNTEWWQWVQGVLDEKGWSLRQFASATGVHASLVAKWRSQNLAPSSDNVRKVADALGEPRMKLLLLAGQLESGDIDTDLSQVPDSALVQEMQRRMTR